MKWVGVAHGINVLSLGVGQIIYLNGSLNNLYIFHFSLIFVYAAYATAFYFSFTNRTLRNVILISIGLFTVISLTITTYIQPVTEYNSYSLTIANIFYLFLALSYLYILILEARIYDFEREPLFWVSIGLLFSSLGNFFALGLMNHLIHRSPDEAYKAHLIVEVMWVLLVIALLISLFAEKIFTRKHY